MGMSALSTFIVPMNADGSEVTAQKRRGVYTLAANTTYYYIFGGASAPTQHVQLTGYIAGAIVTTATIQSCSQPIVSDTSSTDGEWIDEDPAAGDSRIDARVDGTGWSVSTAIVAAGGSGVGGASWHLANWGPARTRLELVIGGTGGDFAVAWAGKE